MFGPLNLGTITVLWLLVLSLHEVLGIHPCNTLRRVGTFPCSQFYKEILILVPRIHCQKNGQCLGCVVRCSGAFSVISFWEQVILCCWWQFHLLLQGALWICIPLFWFQNSGGISYTSDPKSWPHQPSLYFQCPCSLSSASVTS